MLETCGAADCGLVVSSNSTTSRPAKTLVWTLVGCYIGNAAVYFAITTKSGGNQLLSLSLSLAPEYFCSYTTISVSRPVLCCVVWQAWACWPCSSWQCFWTTSTGSRPVSFVGTGSRSVTPFWPRSDCWRTGGCWPSSPSPCTAASNRASSPESTPRCGALQRNKIMA